MSETPDSAQTSQNTLEAAPILRSPREELERQWEGTFGDRPCVVIHTRPMNIGVGGNGRGKMYCSVAEPRTVAEIVSVGVKEADDERVIPLDAISTSNFGTPDLPFTDDTSQLLRSLLETYPDLVVIAPYITYIDNPSWQRLVDSIKADPRKRLIAGRTGNPEDTGGADYIEDKRHFTEILSAAGMERFLPKTSEYTSLDQFYAKGGWEAIRHAYGDKFVVQVASSAGGSGTKLVGTQHTIEDAINMIQGSDGSFKVVEFVDGYETNGSGVVCPDGRVYLDPLTHKPVSDSIRETFGGKKAGAIGDDLSQPWPDNIYDQYQLAMEAVGKVLGQRGYLGIFGIDFIVNQKTGRIVAHEINARPQGTTRIHCLNAIQSGRASSWELHMLLLAGNDLSFMPDPSIVNPAYIRQLGGWQFDIVPKDDEQGKLISASISGTYSLKNGTLVPDPNGDITIVAPRKDQPFTWYAPNGAKRLTSHGQVYCIPGDGVCKAIFDSMRQEPTEYGLQLSQAVRKLLALK